MQLPTPTLYSNFAFQPTTTTLRTLPDPFAPLPPFLRLIQPPHNPRRVTNHNNKIRHILGHHTPRPNSNPPPNSHTPQNSHTPPKPAILPNHNRLPRLRPLEPIPLKRIKRVSSGIKRAIRSNQRPRPNGDSTSIQPSGVVVDVNLLPKLEVEPHVDLDGAVNVGVGEGELGFVLFGVCEDGGVGCVVTDDSMG